ncbi:MAG: MBOAT family protein [Lachnospiraceae bacterium]|jgi:alginate O-acetyltransferase complex protein AlgI|nr:MBOAT family protein [Lachnospiraceae bacterium]HBV84676.1 transcriptional regulator [Lachnospiraceae bacterium]
MLFSSITFLYLFLPFTILFYFFVPQKGRNFVLFVMSLLFYAWGEPVYVLLMLAQIVISYVLLWLVDRYRGKKAARIFYILSVFLPFAALFYFKYFYFFMDTVFGIQTKIIALPIGISFYTFQIVSYCVDVYYNRVERQKNLVTYAAYVTLFPQLVAGPIVRYSEIEHTLTKGIDFSAFHVKFKQGVVRFAVGLGKKVLIANVIGEFVAEVAALGTRNLELSWAYAIAVSLQIYFDFSGYSDMAIGLGGILGFSFPENFRYPFISRSVTEFWRRWHITLGAWFRDYVYIPMGGNRVHMTRWMLNILVVWLFTGLWHGAGWNFITWGLLFAVLLVIEKGVSRLFGGKNPSVNTANKEYVLKKDLTGVTINILKHIYVILVILVSFLIFHNESLLDTITDIQALFAQGSRIAQDVGSVDKAVYAYVMRNRIMILCIGLIGSTPLPLWIWTKLQERLRTFRIGEKIVCVLTGAMVLCVMVLCTAYLIDGSFNPFLYFRF